MTMNIWKKLEASFLANAPRPSITDQDGRSITYHELLTMARETAMNLRSYVQARDRICMLHSHSYHDAVGILSILAADCIGIPMSLNYGENNCRQIIRRAAPAVLLTDLDPMPGEILGIVREQNIEILSITHEINTPFVEPKATEGDIALLMFTSGTTGVPKGAMLTHHNLIHNLDDIAAYFFLSENDHFLIARPLYHGAVMTGEFFHALLHGSKITFYSDPFSPKRLLAFLAANQCTVMCGTPTLFYHMALNKRKTELPYLRKITVSGECLNPEVADKLLEVFPHASFWNVYGLTEASPRVSHLDPEFFSLKIGSVGVPLNHVKAKVVNDQGCEMPRNEIGELMIHGPNVMKGYWCEEELTAQKIVDGWLYTGDLARMDEDGFIYIIGRKDDMIIRAGVNIYPQDIENSLLRDSAIKEVMVWGETAAVSGQRICAAVVPHDHSEMTAKRFLSICREHLEPYQWPDEMMLMEALPRNASGKIMRGRPNDG